MTLSPHSAPPSVSVSDYSLRRALAITFLSLIFLCPTLVSLIPHIALAHGQETAIITEVCFPVWSCHWPTAETAQGE